MALDPFSKRPYCLGMKTTTNMDVRLASDIAFRAAERDVTVHLTCCDCGRLAEGNVWCDDGDVCDACHAAGQFASRAVAL